MTKFELSRSRTRRFGAAQVSSLVTILAVVACAEGASDDIAIAPDGAAPTSGSSRVPEGGQSGIRDGGKTLDASKGDASSQDGDSDSGSTLDAGGFKDSGPADSGGNSGVDAGVAPDPCDTTEPVALAYCMQQNAAWAAACCPPGQHGTGNCQLTQQRCVF
jgi:hypothetical protein